MGFFNRNGTFECIFMNKRSMEHVTRAPGYRQISDESYETTV